MTNIEKAALLEQLSKNQDFLAAISAAESKDGLQKVFSNFDLEMSREEIDAFVEMMNQATSEELNEGELDNVSGGVNAATVLSWGWNAIKAVAKGAWNAGKALANWESTLYS